jgi:hypothetical protein
MIVSAPTHARRWLFGLLLATIVSSGCSDGTVPAKGHVLLEGKPVDSGQLFLSPQGDGPKAVSLVAEDGAFVLKVPERKGKPGAFPGTYRVLFRTQADDDLRKRLEREMAGQISANEVTVSYMSPPDQPVVISESGDEQMQIDIRAADGWGRLLSD